MGIYAVIEKATGEERYRYSSPSPIEWTGFEFSTHDHVPQADEAPVSQPTNSAPWRIHVGALFDRFGTEKLAILANPDPLVQAAIKDATVRKFIDLTGRRSELLQVIAMLNSKGHAVDAAAVLDLEPTNEEIWND